MPKYFCAECARIACGFPELEHETVVFTSYQERKFEKHSARSTQYAVQSVFLTTVAEAYQRLLRLVLNEGFVILEDNGNHSMVASAGQCTGWKYVYNERPLECDGLKAVLTTDVNRIHVFPVATSDFGLASCHLCETTALL